MAGGYVVVVIKDLEQILITFLSIKDLKRNVKYVVVNTGLKIYV